MELIDAAKKIAKALKDGRKVKPQALAEMEAAIKEEETKSAEGPDDDAFISAARDEHVTGDGEVNIDDGAVVSQSDNGAYVAAWLWVTNEAAGVNDEEEDKES